jgi:hypothetical protein
VLILLLTGTLLIAGTLTGAARCRSLFVQFGVIRRFIAMSFESDKFSSQSEIHR